MVTIEHHEKPQLGLYTSHWLVGQLYFSQSI